MKNLLVKIISNFNYKLENFKNKHSNESCYIFGDGISLKSFNLKLFNDHKAFFINNVIFHKDVHTLNLSYGVALRPLFFYEIFRKPDNKKKKFYFRNYLINYYKKKIKRYSDINFFLDFSNFPMLLKQNTFYLFREYTDINFEFFKECSKKNIKNFDSGLKGAISMAIYMGFKEIYLIGCDYTHEKSFSRHWYQKGSGIYYKLPNYYREFFQIACKYTKIITITKEGKGSVLPSMTYSQYTGKKLTYKENTELLDIELLNIFEKIKGNVF